jgi:hypothetical protein
METQCIRHPFESSESACRNCGNGFCGECLVYAFGPDKPPYCVPCALAAAGVRSNAGNAPVASKREIRRMEKERRKAAKAAKKSPVAPSFALPDDGSAPAPPLLDGNANPLSWDDDPSDRVHF